MRKFYFIILLISGCFYSSAQIVDFDFTPKSGCDSLSVTFTDNSFVSDISNFTCVWDFGNGDTYVANEYAKRNPPAVRYSVPGNYPVTLTIGTKSLTKNVTVQGSPNSNFQIVDSASAGHFTYILKAPQQQVALPDSNYTWILNNDTLHKPVVEYTFDSAGTYKVGLSIKDNTPLHCKSLYVKTLYAYDKLQIYNYINPFNEWREDDYFSVPTNGTNIYRFTVYSRSGLRVYQSEATVIFWDGYLASGELAKAGTYFYVIEPLSGNNMTVEKGYMILQY